MHDESYYGLEDKSWAEVVQLNERKWRSPYSVHIPVHPQHTSTFVYVDCALNAYTLPVLPDIKTAMPELKAILGGIETMIVQFAFDEIAFLPDFRLSRIELSEGRFPIVKAYYYAWDMLYEIEYFCSRIDSMQNALWVSVSVTNKGDERRDAHVRTKVNFQKEKELFDYHYVPFYWDVTKWRPDKTVGLYEHKISRNGEFIGLVKDNDFDLKWEGLINFKDSDYNRRFNCSRPYFVQPKLRLKKASDLLHFYGSLAPEEKKTFTIALLSDYSKGTALQKAVLEKTDVKTARKIILDEFRNITDSPERAQLEFSQDKMDKIFTELQIASCQMLLETGKGMQPCQGGSSERFYIWVWEAMHMLRPFLKIGHFHSVRKVVEFIFSLQDGGCPPEGEFKSLEGAIGTTGPRWMNATGSALILASEYWLYSRDTQFLDMFLEKMIRAANWIIGEIRATRKITPEGLRSPVYGLLPFGCATDGDIGYIVAFSDAFSYLGMKRFSLLLKTIKHESFDEVDSELKKYRLDIDNAIDYMTDENGFIERKIVLDGDNSRIARKFNNICGAQLLTITESLSPQDKRFNRHGEYCERNSAKGFFCGRMDSDIMYIGLGEYTWHHAYMCMGHWKKAYSAFQTNLKYGMTSDAFLTQERFSLTEPAYTPWQPNSSGNGRMLDMIIKQFYFEYDDIDYGPSTILFGGMPPSWFEINQKMGLKGLYTLEGRVSIETTGFDFRITCDGFSLKNKIIRIPEYFNVNFKDTIIEKIGNGFFKIIEDISSLSGTL